LNLNLPFEKWTGAGNDFIFLRKDDLPSAVSPSLVARSICSRTFSVGADGFLLIDGDSAEYWNSDGSPADFCGNAARCFGRYIFENITSELGDDHRIAPGTSFQMKLGTVSSSAYFGPSGLMTVSVPAPIVIAPDVSLDKLAATSRIETAALTKALLIDSGVPHLVLCTEPGEKGQAFFEMPSDRLCEIATSLQPTFLPEGTNVDLLKMKTEYGSYDSDPAQRMEETKTRNLAAAALRTWERGVGSETLACGSGALAAALVLDLLQNHDQSSPKGQTISIETRGGDILEIENSEKTWMLRGPAFRICRGRAELILEQ